MDKIFHEIRGKGRIQNNRVYAGESPKITVTPDGSLKIQSQECGMVIAAGWWYIGLAQSPETEGYGVYED